MKNILFNEIINRFYSKGRLKVCFLFFLSLVAGLFEYLGLVLIFWFILFLSDSNSKYGQIIISLFNDFGITEQSKISVIFGIIIALIYIVKNLYMFLFVKYNNLILEDLSVKITLKMAKNILFGEFLKVSSYTNEEKINLIYKITIIVWFYCVRFIDLITNCLIALILISYLFIKFTTVALVAFCFILILSLVEYLYLKKKSNFQSKNYNKTYNEANSSLLKVINLAKEIRLNNKEEEYLDIVNESYKKFAYINQDRNFNSVFHIYFTEISIMIAFISVLLVLFYSTSFDNQMLIASLSTICVIILRLTPTINRAQSALFAINSNKSAVNELLEFDNSFKNIDANYSKEKIQLNEKIELKNINFAYSDEKEGLKDINISINKNDFVGIVGKSGCYKTTLSLILSGLIMPDSGELLIDNQKIDTKNIKKWQNNISLLGQEFEILCDDFSNIDNKLKEELQVQDLENGKFSFGQKQRLALLNLLMQDKDVLILDEATSASDVLNEEKINELLAEYKNKKTIISIAHRFQTLKNCDKIIYMDAGKIIDYDTFENLAKKYDEFEKMVRLSNFNL